MSRAAVVVEDRYSGVFRLRHVRPGVVADGLAEAQVRFPDVPIVFCETRALDVVASLVPVAERAARLMPAGTYPRPNPRRPRCARGLSPKVFRSPTGVAHGGR